MSERSGPLWMDALFALMTPGTLAARASIRPKRFRGWRERGARHGEQWLRSAAEEGDSYAMQKLGIRLFEGDGLDRNIEEGLIWLRRSAERGNTLGMERLAAALLEVENAAHCLEAEQWLQRAIDCGDRGAAVTLGYRLITGQGLLADPDRGQALLIDAIRRGNQLACIKLAIYLKDGIGLQRDAQAGRLWLRCVGAIQPAQIGALGAQLYMRIQAGLPNEVRGQMREVASLFCESLSQGHMAAGLNVAYLVRRGEMDAHCDLDSLLGEFVRRGHSFATVNQALRLAKGVQAPIDWRAADMMIRGLRDPDSALAWWFGQSEAGDPEGHLVVGWLVRHRLATDPEHVPFAERIELARQGGWSAPAWMSLAAGDLQ